MGLFNRLFGNNSKAENAQKKERKALGLKDEEELARESAKPEPTKTTPAPKAADAKAEKPEAKPEKAEAKPEKAEAKPEKVEAKPEKAEVKPEKVEAKVEKAEAKAEKVEAKPEKVETKPEKAEAKGEKAEVKAAKPTAEKKSAPKADEKAPVEVAIVDETTTAAPTGTSGRFEIKKSKDGRFVFNLYAKNHVIVATSQVYSSSTSAVGGIKSVIVNAPIAPVEDQTLKTYETLGYPKWEMYQDKGGQYRFRLCAPNGSCICHSQGYTNKTNCKNGIQSIIRSCQDASIDKIYLKKDGD